MSYLYLNSLLISALKTQQRIEFAHLGKIVKVPKKKEETKVRETRMTQLRTCSVGTMFCSDHLKKNRKKNFDFFFKKIKKIKKIKNKFFFFFENF